MLGWSIAIIRGGELKTREISPYHWLRIEDGTQLLYIETVRDLNALDPLSELQTSPEVEHCGDGYPYIWQLPVRLLTPFLEMLDQRQPGPFDSERNARETIASCGIPDDELVFVEAWDQS